MCAVVIKGQVAGSVSDVCKAPYTVAKDSEARAWATASPREMIDSLSNASVGSYCSYYSEVGPEMLNWF